MTARLNRRLQSLDNRDVYFNSSGMTRKWDDFRFRKIIFCCKCKIMEKQENPGTLDVSTFYLFVCGGGGGEGPNCSNTSHPGEEWNKVRGGQLSTPGLAVREKFYGGSDYTLLISPISVFHGMKEDVLSNRPYSLAVLSVF